MAIVPLNPVPDLDSPQEASCGSPGLRLPLVSYTPPMPLSSYVTSLLSGRMHNPQMFPLLHHSLHWLLHPSSSLPSPAVPISMPHSGDPHLRRQDFLLTLPLQEVRCWKIVSSYGTRRIAPWQDLAPEPAAQFQRRPMAGNPRLCRNDPYGSLLKDDIGSVLRERKHRCMVLHSIIQRVR